jgi:hypothetical protein
VRIVGNLGPLLMRAGRRYETWRLARIARRQVASLPPLAGAGLDEATRAEALSFLTSLVQGYGDLRWHQAYARANGRPAANYVPEDIFQALVLPVLNPQKRAAILADKNHLNLLEGLPPLPSTVGRLVNGRLLDARYLPATVAELIRQLPPGSHLVVKPSRPSVTGGGIGVVEVSGLANALDGLADAIIQLPVQQHRDIAVLNTTSVNTMLITTWRRLDGALMHLGAFLRMGRNGSRSDNTEAGGLFCAIDGDRGVLAADAYARHGARVYQAHPDNGLLFAGRKVPGFAAARDACLAAHRHLPWIDLASWDVALDTAGHPVVVDVCVKPDAGPAQIALGPIFAPVLDDLRSRVGRRRYSRLAGFY